jgi:uncharacterized protein (DUF3084 family)
MTHNITEKKLLIRQQLENVVAEYNKTLKVKERLFNQATELQGALKVLEELDHVHTDQPSETEPTEGS